MTVVLKKTADLTEVVPFVIRAERPSDIAAREALLDASFGESRHARTCQRLRGEIMSGKSDSRCRARPKQPLANCRSE